MSKFLSTGVSFVRSSDAVRSRALIAVAGAVVVVLAVVVAVRVFGGESSNAAGQTSSSKPSSEDSPDPSSKASSAPVKSVKVSKMPTSMPTSTPRLDADQKAAGAKAKSRFEAFLTQSSAGLARNNGKADVSTYAAGPALGEITALAAQYDNEDMKISGAPKVLGAEVVAAKPSANPPSVTLAVCLDNSPVIVRDAKGRNLSKRRLPSELKVLNLYELQQVDGSWLVVNHSIPADSSCKQMNF